MSTKPSFPLLRDSHATLAETLDVQRQRDLLLRRRFLMSAMGGAAALALTPLRTMACTLIPSETAGPYPGDGTNQNGTNALNQTGVVRSDIRSSFGSAGTTTATGTLLTLGIKLVSTTTSCVDLSGFAVYVWHCDASGRYSMYSQGATTQNYLRGVQLTDADGEAVFTTIFPGCYAGRWPHIHFEIYQTLARATVGSNSLRTSQLALPQAACQSVYAQSGLYPNSTQNLSQITLHSDNVFGDDNGVNQIPTLSGDNASGYVASLEVGVNATPNAAADLIYADDFEV